MKHVKSMKQKTIVLALALAFAAGPVAANASNVDNISGTQNYQYSDSSGNSYTLYDFTGTSANNVLQFGSSSGYGPLVDNAIVLPGVETNSSTANAAVNDSIEWQAGGQPTNRLAIANINLQTGAVESPVPGNGTLSIITDPFSGSNPQNYLNLILAGDQSLGAANLNFVGWGRISFGSKSGAIGDTQSLSQLQMNSDFSGILDFYKANTNIGTVLFGGNGFFTSTGGVSTVNMGQVYSPGDVSFGGLTPAGASITFNVGGVQAKSIVIGGSAPGSVTYHMPAGSINLGGTGTAILDASSVNFGEVGVNGNVNLVGGNLTVAPSPLGLQIGGNYFQNGGNLTLDITPGGQRGFIGTSGTYQITSGNVLVSGETGAYTNGAGYTLLESRSTSGGNVYNPENTYYIYNGASGNSIDGLTAYLKQVTDANGQQYVQLCLGSSCVPTPSQPSQPSKPTKTSPSSPAQPVKPTKAIPAQPPQPIIPVIPVHVVTPVQEAKPILADSAGVTQVATQNTVQSLVSTGVVGGGPRGLWVKGMGGFSRQGAYDGMNYGLIAGYGKSVGNDGRDVAGVAFSAGQAGFGTGQNDFIKASDYGLWLYGTYYPQASRAWKITGTLGGGMSTNTLMSTALGLPQTAHFGGAFIGTEIRASYWKTLPELDNVIVSPRLSIGYNQSWTNGYATHGGGPLDVQASGQRDGQFYVSPAILIGKKFDYRSVSGNHTFFPQIRVGMVESVGPNPSAEISSGQVAGQVQGLAFPHTQGMVEARLDIVSHTRYSRGLSANISVRQLFGGGAASLEGVAAIKYHW
ncbi:outer membrane autotransporter barrel domain protein [Acidithiobacillus ferrivorans SS3]|uniref:Outer membrane autotransporter barrel domain protein n=1 Tax=Acidithiobacillus ferrivorans SS3 TaxID=743299 RepID=G0JL26_9PROT|nr:autotransporter outer membrane beta-barrel domain-containing protein [Acidithiobacillus ferrivorans]AEM48023.1 outer membrane autotransporter barrel domain protein [Acidithiobacillus ferrivorans SS3]